MKLICPSCKHQVYLDLSTKYKLVATTAVKGAGVTPVTGDFIETEDALVKYFCPSCKAVFEAERISSLLVLCGECETAVPVTEAVAVYGNVRCDNCATKLTPGMKLLEPRGFRPQKQVSIAVALRNVK